MTDKKYRISQEGKWKNMNILIFGAGSTARGHLSALLYENGYTDITYIDKDSGLVKMLNDSKGYDIHLLGSNERTLTVRDYVIIDRMQTVEIINAFFSADIVLTAVIAENLNNISHVIAAAIENRRVKGKTAYLNIIACENLCNASSFLKKCTYENLSAEGIAYADEYVGFPDAIISRVVPLAKDQPLCLIAEDYNEWYVRCSDFKGHDPKWPFMELVTHLEPLLERKLWIHNGGHATVAYAGYLRGYRYIHEAVADIDVAELAVNVMKQIGNAICHKHGFDKEVIERYITVFAQRGAIEEMMDDIKRVVRDPIRKLGLADRLLAPAVYAEENGLPNDRIVESILNVTRYCSEGDAESVRMKTFIDESGLALFFVNVIGLNRDSTLLKKLVNEGEIPDETGKNS
jgi:mannitol-1-phosphate 5-dehydrogenase